MNYLMLHYYMIASETLNFTKAAEQLYISQQALSSSIKSLEKELGVELFNRGKNLTLTYAGLRFKSYAAEMIQIERRMRSEMNRLHVSERGEITFAINETRAFAVLPAIMPQFYEEFPYVEVSIYEGDTTTLLSAIGNRKADISIGAGLKQQGITEEILLTEKMCLLVPVQFLNPQMVGEELQEGRELPRSVSNMLMFKEMPFIMLNKQMPIRKWADHYLENEGIVPNILLETTGVHTMFSLVERGLGITFCQETLLHSFRSELEAQNSKVMVFPIQSPTAPVINLGFYYHSDAVLPRYTIRLMEIIREFYETNEIRYEAGRVRFLKQ